MKFANQKTVWRTKPEEIVGMEESNDSIAVVMQPNGENFVHSSPIKFNFFIYAVCVDEFYTMSI